MENSCAPDLANARDGGVRVYETVARAARKPTSALHTRGDRQKFFSLYLSGSWNEIKSKNFPNYYHIFIAFRSKGEKRRAARVSKWPNRSAARLNAKYGESETVSRNVVRKFRPGRGRRMSRHAENGEVREWRELK